MPEYIHGWTNEDAPDLMIPIESYRPRFLSTNMINGVNSIRYHLITQHGLIANEVYLMSADDCYRKHDKLHGGESIPLEGDA